MYLGDGAGRLPTQQPIDLGEYATRCELGDVDGVPPGRVRLADMNDDDRLDILVGTGRDASCPLSGCSGFVDDDLYAALTPPRLTILLAE